MAQEQQRHGFFQYIHLKIIVTLFRVLMPWASKERRNRDNALVPQNIARERVKIPSRDAKRHILADLYYPPNYSSSSTSPVPILVNWHGSGFIMPLFGTDNFFCYRVARDAGIIVLDADYRKGPETPFPGAIHDVEDVLRWVATQNHRFDTSRIALSGFSAGGTLSTVAATAIRKKLEDLITVLVVFSLYPLLDFAAPVESKTVPKPVRAHPPFLLRLFNDAYVPDESTRTDPLVSPNFADAADFPETTVLVTCEGDILRPEADELAERLLRANVPNKTVIHKMLQGVPHGFDKGVKKGTVGWGRREELYTIVVKLLKDTLGL
ncbi:Alpha/Beta hydrolase protein [Hypoxylon trugodes]|uniref:Alpha/Beta hydrolase protein n=1 Tax=Hypoxylon trugodes TaxID=326681 RepID=UPI00219AF348|nr:Alpha/Beta hydrolase protein [Hypoxylon trugodes]KAI1389117.1 Alpha/Beta hydrolase protein [Hypoxylon trugodes]